MTDIEYLMNLFKVDEQKAQELISSGFRVDVLRQGWGSELNSELKEIDKDLKTVIDEFFEEGQK